jgi:hypothetical protein
MSDKNPSENKDIKQAQKDANRDPLSGAAGAHPVGVGVGAASGGLAAGVAAGAAIGTVAGPVGTAIGGAVGAVVGAIGGGYAGKGVAEKVDPTVEHGYWQKNYSSRPYAKSGDSYDRYAPAYQYGWEAQAKHAEKSFEQAEPTLKNNWESARGQSNLDWNGARPAVRDSWDRVSQSKAGRQSDSNR